MKKKDQILLEQIYCVLEKVTTAKNFVKQGVLSQEDFEMLVDADPTNQKKYVGWMATQWVNKNVDDINVLRNTIEEYNSFLERGKVKNRDIYQYKSFEDLKKEIDHLNAQGADVTVKDLENDFETIKNDNELLIMVPHTHEASRKLGLSYFAFRDCGDGNKDSKWCTTYKNPSHWYDAYHKHNATLYYIRVKSEELIKKLEDAGFGPEYTVVAIAVLDQDMSERASQHGLPNMDAYDGKDNQFKGETLQRYLDIIGVK